MPRLGDGGSGGRRILNLHKTAHHPRRPCNAPVRCRADMGSGKEQDMASEWMVRGVPVRIAEDAWWLDDGGKPENPEAETRLPR